MSPSATPPSSWPAGRACSPPSPTPRTCRSTPRSRLTSQARRHHRAARRPGRPRAAVPLPAGLAGRRGAARQPARRTRQVNNFGMGTGMECVKMLATEVLTPASNWSSYPPHKHDEDNGTETELEEIYYYKFASTAPAGNPARGCEIHWLPTGVRHRRAAHRGAGGSLRRRHRARPARLARSVHRRAVAPHVLPERDGRTRRGTCVGDQRRPQPRLGARRPGPTSPPIRGCRSTRHRPQTLTPER